MEIAVLVLSILSFIFCFFSFIILIFMSVLIMRMSGFIASFAKHMEARFKKLYSDIFEEEEETKLESGLVDLPNVDTYDPRFKS